MTIRSYSPNGLQEYDPDYLCCFNAFHVVKAARVLSIYWFLLCLLLAGVNFFWFGFDKTEASIVSILMTIYAVLILYGVFLEKRCILGFYLVTQGFAIFIFVVLTLAYAGFGAFTNIIQEEHERREPLRELYKMHDLDPDDERTQTIVCSALLFLLIINIAVQIFSWIIIYQTFKCFKHREITVGPENGYQRGNIVADSDDQD